MKDNVKKRPKTSKPEMPSKARVRRQQIATSVVQGKTEKQIAAELGMSRPGVRDAKAHPETRDFIRQLSAHLAAEIERNNKRMVDAIYEGMNAKTGANRPDHKIRQMAVAHQIKLLGKIQPKDDNANAEVAVSLTQLREALGV